jgi:hypothetical protein
MKKLSFNYRNKEKEYKKNSMQKLDWRLMEESHEKMLF